MALGISTVSNKVEIIDGDSRYIFRVEDVKEIRRYSKSHYNTQFGTVTFIHVQISFTDNRNIIHLSRGKLIADDLDRLYQTLRKVVRNEN